MPTMFVRQQVPSYKQWKQAFDIMAENRATFGLTVQGIYRSVANENEVCLILDAASLEQAKAFAESTVLAHGRDAALGAEHIAATAWLIDNDGFAVS
jgi:hypothetical protein